MFLVRCVMFVMLMVVLTLLMCDALFWMMRDDYVSFLAGLCAGAKVLSRTRGERGDRGL